MSDHQHELEQSEQEDETDDMNTNATNTPAPESAAANRRERRKLTKKEKRKKKRKEVAETARRIDEARLNDPEEVMRLEAEEEAENARIESERKEFEERERRIVEDWERRRAIEEEERRRIALEEEEEQLKGNQVGQENELDEDGWEYVEDGPPEIIWQGNEIIVKKKKVRVKKKETDQQIVKEDPNRPTSNPLPPQSEAFADYKNGFLPSAQQLLENVAQQTPNFGTEQDKAHCPFHLKTGACRFGSRCSRIHFYPDKSCTFLIKNMYNGPGLAWEQDEGLEHTDEEVERAYEEFYEDVHTEFLKFGEIVNFKVCRNGASHLRGNVYVHFKSLDSAVLAYQSVNGRYFAGKLVQCEFVGVTKWKVAICGEYMKSKLKTCSRGMTCNFIHCFRNPGGDYEWADWDKPPPRYWVEKMVALFGFSDESGNGKQTERRSPGSLRNSSRIPTNDADRYCSRRSQSRDIEFSRGSRNYRNNDVHSSSHRRHPRNTDRKESEIVDGEDQRDDKSSRAKRNGKNASSDSDSDRNRLERDRSRSSRRSDSSRKRSRAHSNENLESQGSQSERTRMRKSDANANSDSNREKHDHHTLSRRKTTEQEKIVGEGHEGRSRWEWSDEDNRHKAGSQSGTSTRARRRSKVFTSPNNLLDGRSRTDDNNLTGDWSDGEKGVSSPIYAERRPRSHAREESEDEKSKHKLNCSSSEEYTVRGSEEVDCDRGKHHSGRRYKSPGSGSRKDIDRSKDGDSKNESHGSNRKSKRKRDSESRVQYHEGKISRVSNYQSDEDTEERGRWEPE